MTSLFLETSSERAVLFFYDGEVRFLKEFPFGLNNSKAIFPALHEGLDALNLVVKDLSFITVGCGPGSYTGMRVGASVALGLSYAANLPLVGVPSLACYVPDVEGPFVVLVDAKIRGAYLMTGVFVQGCVRHTSLSQVLPLEELKEILHGSLSIVTPNATTLRPKLLALYPDLPCIWKECAPDPEQMAKLGSESGLRVVTGRPALDLLYL